MHHSENMRATKIYRDIRTSILLPPGVPIQGSKVAMLRGRQEEKCGRCGSWQGREKKGGKKRGKKREKRKGKKKERERKKVRKEKGKKEKELHKKYHNFVGLRNEEEIEI